ncbi:MAG: hypothetical protein GX491_13195 [Chloroflexi bacterium]|nr:hypothetical protein [Chloroflexota bacterium]
MRSLYTSAAQILLLIGLVMALIAPGRTVVHAQAGSLVQITPEQNQVDASQAVTLALQITGGENVNAFDVSVRYDPAVLVLESHAYGSYLTNIVEVKKEDRPGYFRLAAAQLASAPVSGDGVLLNLVFRGTAEGSSPVTLESAQLAGADGTSMLPAVQHSSIVVNPAPEETAVSEPTITSSPTFTLQPPEPAQPTPIPPTPTSPPASPTLPASTPTPTITPLAAAALPTAGPASPTPEPAPPTPGPAAALTGDPAPAQDAPTAPPAAETRLAAAVAEEEKTGRLPPILQWLEIVLWTVVTVCVLLSIYMLVALIKRRK